MMETVASQLAIQSEQVHFIEEAAESSRENVQKGNRELARAAERPSTMRDFVLMFLAILGLVLLFLDWYTP